MGPKKGKRILKMIDSKGRSWDDGVRDIDNTGTEGGGREFF